MLKVNTIGWQLKIRKKSKGQYRMDNQKTKAIRGTRHRTMTNETKKNKEKKHIVFYCGSNDLVV